MSASGHKRFFSQRKIFSLILLLIIIFFISYVAQFSLSSAESALNLSNIKYCYTSHEKILPSETNMDSAYDISEIEKKAGNKYLYVEAQLPEASQKSLVISSVNAAAKITVNEKELFNNIEGKRPSGSSYITVNLDDDMAGKKITILLYSPLSNYFDIRLQPNDESAFARSSVPFAFFIILALMSVLFIGCLISCLIANKTNARASTYLILLAFLMAIAAFVFEYMPEASDRQFLFNLKLFFYLLIPIIILLELILRFNAWDRKAEALLSIDIAYAFSVLFLGNNVFFFPLLNSSVFFQATNLLLSLNIVLKQSKPVKEIYCVANIAFWCVDIILWFSVALHRIHWQPISFIAATVIYSLIGAYLYCAAESAKKPKKNSGALSRKKSAAETQTSYSASIESGGSIPEGGYGPIVIGANSAAFGELPGITENNISALAEFCNMIMKKVYGKNRHSYNVSEYSRIISYSMGMSEQSVNEIAKAALLHDIGKICVSENILFKTGKLSEEEFQEIKKHNIYGYQLLASNDDEFFKMAALVAKEHHEHIDGSGYLGLKGSEISIPAKIVAVADVFDALVSKRSYKEAWSFEDSVSYIAEHSNNYFDKDVVGSFINAKDRIYDLYLLSNDSKTQTDSGERS